MRKMFSEKQIVGVVNDAIEQGEIEVGGSLYRHYVVLSKTNDEENEPYVVFEFYSTKSSYTKVEIQNYIKRVATTVNYKTGGIIGIGINGNYAPNSQGNYVIHFKSSNNHFIAESYPNSSASQSIDYGTAIPYVTVSSKAVD